MGAWAGGVAQGISSRNAMNMQKEANNELTRRMEIARQAYQARRPQMAKQKYDALQQQLGMFNPVIGMMGEMTGGRYAPDLSGLTNPVKPQATAAELAYGTRDKNDHTVLPEDMRRSAQREARGRLADQGFDVSTARVGRRRK